MESTSFSERNLSLPSLIIYAIVSENIHNVIYRKVIRGLLGRWLFQRNITVGIRHSRISRGTFGLHCLHILNPKSDTHNQSIWLDAKRLRLNRRTPKMYPTLDHSKWLSDSGTASSTSSSRIKTNWCYAGSHFQRDAQWHGAMDYGESENP